MGIRVIVVLEKEVNVVVVVALLYEPAAYPRPPAIRIATIRLESIALFVSGHWHGAR